MAIKETVEREVKLRAGDAFRLPELGGEAIEPREFVSTYHDTADHRLARRGITLRHRVENGKGLWQLKLPHGNARLELEEPGAPTEPPEALSALLAGHLRGVPLLPIARLRTHREGVRADGAEVVHDTVAVLDHQRVTRSFEELEVELLDGDEKTLRRLGLELEIESLEDLGPVRDLEVLIERLAAEVSTLGVDETEGRKLVRTLDRSRRSARRRLLTALSSARYFALLDALERPFATIADEPSLAEIHAAEHRKLKQVVHSLASDSPDEELHAARIRVKRARYAAELEGDKPYVSAAKRLQDVLGEHQDAVVAIEKLRNLAGRTPDAAVAAGRLIEREQERARRTRGAWRASWKQLAKTV